MKFGTDKMEIEDSVSTVFTFKLHICHLKEFDYYITLHNLKYATYVRSDP